MTAHAGVLDQTPARPVPASSDSRSHAQRGAMQEHTGFLPWGPCSRGPAHDCQE